MKKFLSFVSHSWHKVLFIAMGIASLIWFLVRVIPKPSRAFYPCMRAAAPFASSFVAYLIGLGTATFFLRKARQGFKKARFAIASVFLMTGLVFGFISQTLSDAKLNAQQLQDRQPANVPLGEAKGIFPGRVVWEHNPEATDENCSNDVADYWYQDDNTDQDVVNAMVSSGLQNLTGTNSDEDAWDAIFKYYNNTHERGDVGYTSGEKIVIKINMNGLGNRWTSDPPKNINTAPQLSLAILDQLVNKAGVAEEDISIGDPNVGMDDNTYNKLSNEFPDVTYWGSGTGRVSATGTASAVLFSSNQDSPDKTSDKLPQAYVDATYMLNIPVFKKHHRAGISLTSKNHFGSLAPYAGGAWHQHYALPCPDATSEVTNGEYGVYRCFVDIMGHKDLGGKTILYLIDGLWGSTNWGHPPVKWAMTPFNGDYPNSLFFSQDPVAIESVCYDFLYEEFDEDHPTEGEFEGDDKGPYAQFPGTDDFLQQAADPSLWPAGIDYDPENDGSILSSMGAHEHWNNATDKQYSRNLDTGNGIELFSSLVITSTQGTEFIPEGFEMYQNYPNPFSQGTTLRYRLGVPSQVTVNIYSTSGSLVASLESSQRMSGDCELYWDGRTNSGSHVDAGMYICKMIVENNRGTFEMSRSLVAAE